MLAASISSDDGPRVLGAIFGDAAPQWWRDLLRDAEIGRKVVEIVKQRI